MFFGMKQRLKMFYKKGVHKNSARFTGKHFVKCLRRTPFLQSTSGLLFLFGIEPLIVSEVLVVGKYW